MFNVWVLLKLKTDALLQAKVCRSYANFTNLPFKVLRTMGKDSKSLTQFLCYFLILNGFYLAGRCCNIVGIIHKYRHKLLLVT
jgi:hypothetical protein